MSSLYSHVVDAMGIAVLVRTRESRFHVETAPRWLSSLIEGVNEGDIVDVVERFPFLDTFMPDAESIWEDPIPGIEVSGIWVEQQSCGTEIPLEAFATRSQSDCLLLLRIPWAEYEEKREFLTKARTSKLAHERLRKEIQKKEILLHCIIHDLANPLSGIKSALDLMCRRPLDDDLTRYIDICKRLSDDQHRLIRSILDAFSAEFSSPEVGSLEADEVPDARVSLRIVQENMLPPFSVRDVSLVASDDIPDGEDRRVAIDSTSLERVLTNLVENALRHSPRGATVTMSALRKDGAFVFTVDDEGPGTPPELAESLFEKFSQGKNRRGQAGLGLYFCRITAERWGGAIGHENLEGGGCRFWFTLPAYQS